MSEKKSEVGSQKSETPRSDGAWDAFNRKACGLAYVRHQMEGLERNVQTLCKDWAEDDTNIKNLCAKCGIKPVSSDDYFKDRVQCVEELVEEYLALERELEELKAWRAGKKGIEDYYIVKEKLYVAETAADMWRKCATNLAEAYTLDSNNLHSVEAALDEFEKLKGKA